MDSVKRILHVITGMGSGGAEKMIMNWYRNIDKEKYQFDFLLHSDENLYKDEILSMGGRIFTMPDYPLHAIKNHRETEKFFKEHAKEYHAVHVHANALLYVDAIKLAKKYGINKRIMHSHNTKCEYFVYRPFHEYNKRHIKEYATDCLACADLAGKWMFKDGYTVINNAVDLEEFTFNADARERIRKEENIEGKFVVGHIGRFLKSKNHPYLFKVFKEILKEKENSVLLLIGEGKLEKRIKKLAEEMEIMPYVRFLGVKKNTNEYYSAFDVLVFPSLFEGLGIVAVESQICSLKTIASFAVPEEAQITDYLERISIDDNPSAWAKEALKYTNGYERTFRYEAFCEHGYEIKASVKRLEKIYGQ